ncbi:uncharacterized protein LOC110462684 [Mizuhopecten yessoensis]|uniref:uncharacterized protein LOC110462684 n=1 Tax=Mizuhopecten yessoensis TaxID=6573 RepID=UPI000B45E354|nr:uncharacterized protein LOC110462684 [Mizuhopecten yessoensis]
MYQCTVFIEKLIERLTYFGEDDKTLHYVFTNNIDLPPPKLKRAAITGSQPVDVDESNRLTKELAALQKKLEEITALQEEKATLESKVEKKTKEMDQLLMDISETTNRTLKCTMYVVTYSTTFRKRL